MGYFIYIDFMFESWFDNIYEKDSHMISTKKRIGKYILFLNEKLGKGAYSEVFKGVEEDTK